MRKFVFQTLQVALICAVPLAGQSPVTAQAADAYSLNNAGRQSSCDGLCPHCGCRLVPVCQADCTTKKVTTYKYTCKSEDICVLGPTRCCDKSRAGTCCTRCSVHHVHRLTKYPCVKEEAVKNCSVVSWNCPNCGCCVGKPSPSQSAPTSPPTNVPASAAPMPAALPAAPMPAALRPAPMPAALPPAPPKNVSHWISGMGS